MTSSWPDSRTVGQRVVVRHRTGETAASGRPELSDVLGYVRAADADSVHIEGRDGRIVALRRADTVAWKVVPDPPQRGAAKA